MEHWAQAAPVTVIISKPTATTNVSCALGTNFVGYHHTVHRQITITAQGYPTRTSPMLGGTLLPECALQGSFRIPAAGQACRDNRQVVTQALP